MITQIEGVKKLGDLTKEAMFDIHSLQSGNKVLPLSGFSFIDIHLNGLLPGDCVVISGLSGSGKSETLYRIKENLKNVTLNPLANEYVFLDFNLEVKMLNITLRALARLLGIKKQEILFNKFTDDQKIKVEEYYKSTLDDRQYVVQDETTPEQFYQKSREFLLDNKDRKGVFISFDHAYLIASKNKQEGIEQLVSNINKLKLEFDNVYFIVLSQLNRSILSRVAERDNSSCANASDIFASSVLDFISSYNIVVMDAYKMGISEFMNVKPSRYPYLEEFFTDEDKKGRVSFNTQSNLFYKVIKTRESDYMHKDLFIVSKDLSEEEEEFMKNQQIRTLPKHPSSLPEFLKKEEKNTDQKDMEGNRPSDDDLDNIPF